MEWIVLTAALIIALAITYAKLREELKNNKSKQLNALKEQVKQQNELAKKKDAEYLSNTDAAGVVGFLNRLRKDD